MKLISLSLKAFRQHRETEIRFQDGITGIIGANGSGKSTILEAIAFAFFGSRALRGRVDQVRCLSLPPKQEVKVVLSFEHDTITYRVERTLNDAVLFIAGEASPHIRGNTEVTNKISSIFRMNYEEFAATFLTEQKGLEFLSGKKGAAERERFIVRLMGYDKLQAIQEALRDDRKEKRSLVAAWEASLASRDNLSETIQKEERELKDAAERLHQAEKALHTTEREVVKSKKEYEQLQAGFLEYSKLKQQLSLLEVRLQERKERTKALEAKLKALKNPDKDFKLLISGLTECGFNLKETPEIGTLDQHLTNFISELEKEIHTKKAVLDAERAALLEKQLTLKAEIKSLDEQIEASKKRSKNLLSLNEQSQCPTCGQELKGNLTPVKDKISWEISELNNLRSAKHSEAEALKNKNQNINDLSRELVSLTDKLKLLSKKRSELNELLFRDRERASLNHELSALSTELEQTAKEVERLKSSLMELGFSEETYSAKKVQYEASQRLLEVARLQRLKLEGELDKHRALLDKSRKSLIELNEKGRLLDEAKTELLLLEKSDQTLTDLRKHLNAQLRPRLSELASDYLAELSDGRYSTVEIGNDFSPQIFEDGQLKSVISGGEEDLLNICLRLALSSMLAERAGVAFSTLLLDEVFGALDEGRRANVLNLLERLSKRFEQIILITHLEDIKDGVHNLIEINYDETLAEVGLVDRFEVDENDLAVNI